MKNRIYYYSLEGSTRTFAQRIAEKLSLECAEIQPEKEYPTGKGSKFLWGGRDVVMRRKPLLRSYLSPADCDYLLLGFPIWVGTFAPPIRSFLSENNLAGKKVILFATHGGGGAEKSKRDFAALQPDCQILGVKDFRIPLNDHPSEEQLQEFLAWMQEIFKNNQ